MYLAPDAKSPRYRQLFIKGRRMRVKKTQLTVGQVLLAGEESQHRAALPGFVVADRAAEHRTMIRYLSVATSFRSAVRGPGNNRAGCR